MRNLEEVVWTPEKDLSIWSFLEDAAANGGTICVSGVKQTYRELADRANKLAGGLIAAGIKPGDRIATITADTMDYVEILLAGLRAQAIVVPLNPFLKGRFLSYQLEECEPTLLFVDGPGLAASREMFANIPSLKKIIISGEADLSGVSLPVVPVASMHGAPVAEKDYDHDGRRPYLILYTSGTTGNPKGCIITHGTYVKIPANIMLSKGITSKDVIMTSLPLFHGGALMMALFGGIVSGASTHMPGRFSASTYMEEAAEVGATVCMAMSSMGPMLLAQPEKPGDKAHKLRLFVGVPMAVPTQEAFKKRFNVDVWTESFGQTEGLGSMSRIDGLRNPASCGRETPLMEIGIFDENGTRLPANQSGEICSRPRTTGVMYKGYWRKPEATLKAWENLWHHTGDRGYLDENGFLFFVDRIKDSIRRRGENIVSAEVEGAIAEHPKIKAVAIHAVQSEMVAVEDDVKACIIMHEGQSVTPQEIFDFFRLNIPYFAVPRYVEFYEDFPLTGTLKVKKEALRDQGNGPNCWDLEKMGFAIKREDRRASV